MKRKSKSNAGVNAAAWFAAQSFHASVAKCDHQYRQIGPDAGFSGSVATHADFVNPSAHGCISYTQECSVCGCQRSVNQNQGFVEYGPPGPTRAEREAAERAQIATQRHRDRAMATEARVRIVRVTRDQVLVSVLGQPAKWVWLAEVQAAAAQRDTGDGLVPFYRGMLMMIQECEVSA